MGQSSPLQLKPYHQSRWYDLIEWCTYFCCRLWLTSRIESEKRKPSFYSSFNDHFPFVGSRKKTNEGFRHILKSFHNSFLCLDFALHDPCCHLFDAFHPSVQPTAHHKAFHFQLLEIKILHKDEKDTKRWGLQQTQMYGWSWGPWPFALDCMWK